MEPFSQNKRKIINDPVYGFIKIPTDTVFDIIEHPYFQRLRRIRQLGMTHYVYPGSNHTRFQHALGAMHLMGNAIDIIRSKGHDITAGEAEAVTIAILLHDIGHGPFSHSLEMSLIQGVSHEQVSLMIMEMLNREFGGRLDLAIRIFNNEYEKHFLHQLVSSQLDMDRLDYLRRDSFFTGVTEGTIGSDRIIKMLQVHNDRLVVEEKGIYSIEKFLVARRLMYWQVYLHKSVLAADQLLLMMLKRAHELAMNGTDLFATPALSFFLKQPADAFRPNVSEEFIDRFTCLDDNDIISAAKVWSEHDDPVLSFLCRGFVNRKLLKIELRNMPFETEMVEQIREKVGKSFGISRELTRYIVITDSVANHAYSDMDDNIKIMGKDGSVRDIADISEILNVSVLSKKVLKYFLCYPRNDQ